MSHFRMRTFHNEEGPFKTIESIVLIALVFTAISSGVNRTLNTGKRIRSDTLRLHIIANSDEEADQTLKLKVRDRILSETGELFAEVSGKSEAKALAQYSADDIQSVAEKVIAEEGFSYPVSVEVTKTWFETRSYDGFTLPAGDYDAVRVIIGEGEGHNWWCVLYPQLCVPGAENSLRRYGSDVSFVLGDGYELRFAVIEWAEKLKHFFQARQIH